MSTDDELAISLFETQHNVNITLSEAGSDTGSTSASSSTLHFDNSYSSSTENDAGISLDEITSSEDTSVLRNSNNSTADEAGVSLDGMSDSSEDLDVNSVMPREQTDIEIVRLKVPPPRNISTFLSSEVSSGKKMKLKAMSLLSIKSALKESCQCGASCLKKLKLTSVRDVRRSFWVNSKTVRMQLLKNYIMNSMKCGKFRFLKVNKELNVCSKAFMTALRINKNTFSRAMKMCRKNVTISTKKPRDMCTKTLNLMTWLEDYSTYHGDRMPNTMDIVLPYGTSKTFLYERYRQETLVYSPQVVSRTQFYKIWESYFPHLKIKKTNSFSKCTTCTTIERQLEKTNNVSTRAKYRQLKDEHNKRQMMERKYYYSKREASRRDPEKHLSIIIDGMDQSKTNLPHFTGRRAKNVNVADLLKTHITGVINHGYKEFHTFVDINEYPHDPNLTINIILKILKAAAERNRNKLPPILYIQADNCWRENKNRYVLAFCELLVAENIFDEVHLSFLYVGHTHEDVDAAFSRIAENLRTRDAETLDELTAILPRSEMITVMFDIKRWLEPHLNAISGHTEPLHFKFMKQDRNVKCMFKGQHTDPWSELGECLLKEVPHGEPLVLKPDYSNFNVDRQRKQVEVLQPQFKNALSMRIWKDFYDSIASQTRQPNALNLWPLQDLPRQHVVFRENVLNIIPEVRELVQKETHIPKVTIRRKESSGQNQGSIPKKRRTVKNKGQSKTRVSKSVPIFSTEDVKLHIWWMIFISLLERCFSVLFVLNIIFALLNLSCLLSLLSQMGKIFSDLVLYHIGQYSSRAGTEHEMLHSWPDTKMYAAVDITPGPFQSLICVFNS